MMEIKILGPGCAKCHQVEKIVKEAVAETGATADIEHVTDFKRIAEYGVFSTPSVVVNGEVKSVGKVPKKEEIKGWITK
jgi:small redox-active disulfide protein 2